MLRNSVEYYLQIIILKKLSKLKTQVLPGSFFKKGGYYVQGGQKAFITYLGGGAYIYLTDSAFQKIDGLRVDKLYTPVTCKQNPS